MAPRVAAHPFSFDAWLLSEYQAAVDVLGSTGAKVAWGVPTCIEADRNPGFIENREGNARLRHIGRIMNTALAASRPVELVDLDGVVCPNAGSATPSPASPAPAQTAGTSPAPPPTRWPSVGWRRRWPACGD